MVRIPDYEFYKNTYNGRIIDAAEDFPYFAQRAGEQLARFASFLPAAAQDDYSRCVCAVAEVMKENTAVVKNGQPVASESVNGYYSVTYAHTAATSEARRINGKVQIYLGRWLNRAVPVRE